MDHSLYVRATQQAWSIYLARNNTVAPDEASCAVRWNALYMGAGKLERRQTSMS